VANGVVKIRSKPSVKWFYSINDHNRGLLNTNKHVLFYDLELYTDGCEKQYCLRIGVGNNPYNIFVAGFPAGYIPTYAKVLFKLKDSSTLELTSLLNKWDNGIEHVAHFAIDESTLNKLFSGVKKIRMELITYDAKTGNFKKEFREVDYKKDKFGKDIQKAYKTLNKEYSKNERTYLQRIRIDTMTNIGDGF
jgi:hypothetical protein